MRENTNETDHQSSARRPPTLSEEALKELSSQVGVLKTSILRQLETDLSWYRELEAEQRASLGAIAQQGLQAFIDWFATDQPRPANQMNRVLASVFANAPVELSRTVNLRRASQLLRSILDTVETHLPTAVAESDRSTIREAVLRYSREIAFALADVYARAAEKRGAWDTRLEALLLDSVLRGENPEEIQSRAAALGWRATSGILVIAGNTPSENQPAVLPQLRQTATRARVEALVGVFSEQMLLVLGSAEGRHDLIERFTPFFGDGPVIYSSPVDSLREVHHAAHEAIAGFHAAPAYPGAQRPIAASELLAERVLNRDARAQRLLVRFYYQPLKTAGAAMISTLDSYLRPGHSLEATARDMFIHVNTVRYRLRRIAKLTGKDPLNPRDAYVLQIALATGRLMEANTSREY
ncbi:PucR family transcriptional regulator [Auritidibacter ignavus]|uniref:PucR family transcriptional regulator n=1 Tax=Auritidibacter ignavus TaxID=678932 RepID=UPI00244B1EBA|nr:helix-turn-helix domain-containing protein [Auritidibacter ignavus]WGH86505.1 helix-turn-helix domain-containing protein [Auritidibacter ignavus]